jgi:hypothetical protein
VADREERLVVLQLGAAAGAVDVGEVADVVPVLLEEADHRVLVVHRRVAGRVVRGRERPVVADLVAAADDAVADVEAGAAEGVVGLPGLVRGLEEHRRVPLVVAHDEVDVAVAVDAVAHEMGDVEPGDGGRRDRPGGRLGPVAAVGQAARRLGQAGRLQGRRRCRERRDQPRAVALVVADPEDVDVVRAADRGAGRIRVVDLEVDGLPVVDADLGREALQRRVAGAADLPDAGRLAGLRVLADDRVGAGTAGIRRGGSAGDRADPRRADHRRHDDERPEPAGSHRCAPGATAEATGRLHDPREAR